MSDPLANWVHAQLERSVEGLLRSVSAVGLVQVRAGIGQRIVPRPGSILASPVPANYDPEPDYFFHWFRDAALVMDALRQVPPHLLAPAQQRQQFADFVHFNAELARLEGATPPAAVAEDHRVHLRPAQELAALRGAAIWGDVRTNPDATLDVLRWARPQHDGPALRALCILHWLTGVEGLPPAVEQSAATLLEDDLGYLRERGATPGYDVWEEEQAHHFHTRATAAAALTRGAQWLESRGAADAAQASSAAASALWRALDAHWDARAGFIVSRLPSSSVEPSRALDMSVVLAALAIGSAGPFGTRDARVHATLERLTQAFAALYPINQRRAPGQAAALGRYTGDRYFGGNPWYVTTLAAAELCFRAAAGANDAAAAREQRCRGDAWLETVRAYTPADGSLTEQFDRASGAPCSARHLAWSYAAFITCIAAREAAGP